MSAGEFATGMKAGNGSREGGGFVMTPRPEPQGAVVSNFTAILSGVSWSGSGVSGAPVFVTFSFETSAQDYLPDEEIPQNFINSFQAFDAVDRQLALDALQQWGNASGIHFIEVPSGEGEIRFAKYNFDLHSEFSGFAGFAFYPWREIYEFGAYDYGIGGDVFINTLAENDLHLMLHEIGHALGFKHPFEDDPTLAPALDNWAYTVMSYTPDASDGGTLGTFDVQAVQHVYGGPGSDGGHLSSWSWNPTTRVLTQIGTSLGETIFGTGQRDVIEGGGGHDWIAGFEGNDVLSGGDGDDSLFGGPGDDILIGGAGNDIIDGGGDYFRYFNYGVDTVDYSSSTAPIIVDLDYYYATGDAIGTDQLYEIDNVIASNFNDIVGGDANANVLEGRGGDDLLFGWHGNDTLRGGSGADIAIFNVASTAATWTRSGYSWIVQSAEGADTLVSIERLEFTDVTVDLGPLRGPNNDFSGDGTSDILWNQAGTNAVGAFTLDSGAPLFAFYGQGGAGWTIAGTGDLTGDNTTDILWNQTGTNAVGAFLFDSGAPVFAFYGNGGTGWTIAALGDLSGDGTADILWHRAADNVLGAFIMDSGTPSFAYYNNGGDGWAIMGLGDFTGDGTDDILWHHGATNAIGAFIMDSGAPVFAYYNNGGAGWEVAGIGDFSGDGIDDILWHRASDNAIGAFIMDSGTPTFAFYGHAGAGWDIAGIGDYNGDGTEDILMHQASVNTIGAFLLDGGTTTFAFYGQGGDGWDLV